MKRLAAPLLSLFVAACAGSPETRDTSTFPDAQPADPENPVAEDTTPTEATNPDTPPGAVLDLALRTASGAYVDLADYRGAPMLLAFLGSYDTLSQASLDSLTRVAHRHPDMLVVGVLVQQGADMLVDAYAAGAHVPFPITYEPAGDILAGRSAVGELTAIPTFVALDAEGRIAATDSGYASDRRLEELVARAIAAAPIRPAAPPPLLGRPR